MRTIVLLLSLTIITLGIASAQSLPSSGKEPSWVMINDSIVGELVLTLDQRDRLQRLENRYQDEYDRALAEDTLTAGERAIRLRLLSDARQKEIGTIMTGKQYGQWLGLLKRHEEAEERKAALKK